MTEPYTAQDEKMLFVRTRRSVRFIAHVLRVQRSMPESVPVTDELRFLAYNDFGGNFIQAQQNFRQLPKGIQDVRCSDCSSCAIRCPMEWMCATA